MATDLLPSPLQISSTGTPEGNIAGPIDGVNPDFILEPYPQTFQFSLPSVSGILVFRNGLLLDLSGYKQRGAAVTVPDYHAGDTVTIRVWPDGGPTILRLSDGSIIGISESIQAFVPGIAYTPGTGLPGQIIPGFDPVAPAAVPWAFRLYSLNNPAISENVPFMLFLNGKLLTCNLDYTVTNGVWIQLTQQFYSGQNLTALTSTGGTACSTYDGTITGAVDGMNTVFRFPFPVSQSMIFSTVRNSHAGQAQLPGHGLPGQIIPGFNPPPFGGWLLTEGQDYALASPLTFQYDIPDASGVIVFRNGLLLTPEAGDYSVNQDGTLVIPAALETDIVTARVWLIGLPLGGGPTVLTSMNDGVFPTGYAPPTGRAYTPGTGLPGQIIPGFDPVGSIFSFRLVFANEFVSGFARPVMIFKNGLLLTYGLDYTISGVWLTLVVPASPNDFLVVLYSTGGTYCSTYDGTVTEGFRSAGSAYTPGTWLPGQIIPGFNPSPLPDPTVWIFPGPVAGALIFRNGLLMTEGLDYLANGSQIKLLNSVPGQDTSGTWGGSTQTWGSDTGTWGGSSPQGQALPVITAQLYTSRGPVQATTADGSLSQVPAEPPGSVFTVSAPPQAGDTITAQVWI